MKDTIYRKDAIGACAYETVECYEARKAIRALPSAGRPQGEWIPCEERLPEEHGHYLCTVTKPQNIDRIYVVHIYWCGRWYGWANEEVTAWMPLPEPYMKGVDDE